MYIDYVQCAGWGEPDLGVSIKLIFQQLYIYIYILINNHIL